MRRLEGSNRVRNGLMGILILMLVIGVGQSFAACPCCSPSRRTTRSSPTPAASSPATRSASPVWTSARCARSAIDGDKVKIGFSSDGTQIGTDSRAAIRTDTILGRKNVSRSSRAGRTGCAPTALLPLGQTTTPYQIYDAFFDVTKAASRLGHRDGQAVAERAVGDHRPDLPASERRARRGRAVLRHHRQARRPDQATAGQREQDRRRARQPQRTDQRAAGQRADAAGGGQRAQLCRQPAAGDVSAVLRAGRRRSSTTTRT